MPNNLTQSLATLKAVCEKELIETGPWEEHDFYLDMSQMVVDEHCLPIPRYEHAMRCVNALPALIRTVETLAEAITTICSCHCPADTNGDGDCGKRLCPVCGLSGVRELGRDALAAAEAMMKEITK